jgi:hypothetical protein
VPLSDNPAKITGESSGAHGINLAYLFGCRPICLLGFDMIGPNFHTRHPTQPKEARYASHFRPALERMAVALKEREVPVFNATPGSALTCFPYVPLSEILMDGDTSYDEPVTEQAPEPALVEPVTVADLASAAFDQIGHRIRAAALRSTPIQVEIDLTANAKTRRSADWWMRRLRVNFRVVHPVSIDRTRAVFACSHG